MPISSEEVSQRISSSSTHADNSTDKRSDKADMLKPIPLWLEDVEFDAVVSRIRGRTVVSRDRCFVLYQLAKYAGSVEGDAAEIGVYKGGTASLISKALADTGKTVHLFDTFEGMPETDAGKDVHRSGDFADTSLDAVKEFLDDCSNLRFYPGFFPESSAPICDFQFSLVHVDVDIYQSVLDCCEFFHPRMNKGGIIVFDDYGFPTCPGAKIAVDEFFFDKPEYPCYLPTGQCLVIKV